MTFSANSLKILLAAGLLLVGTAVAAQDSAASGQELYQKLCAACHSATPTAMKGKPVDTLVAGMDKVKNMSNPSGGAARMQQVVKTLSPQQMKDITIASNSSSQSAPTCTTILNPCKLRHKTGTWNASNFSSQSATQKQFWTLFAKAATARRAIS